MSSSHFFLYSHSTSVYILNFKRVTFFYRKDYWKISSSTQQKKIIKNKKRNQIRPRLKWTERSGDEHKNDDIDIQLLLLVWLTDEREARRFLIYFTFLLLFLFSFILKSFYNSTIEISTTNSSSRDWKKTRHAHQAENEVSHEKSLIFLCVCFKQLSELYWIFIFLPAILSFTTS